MHATALPVLHVDLWILRINVNQKRKVNTSVEADQSAIFRVRHTWVVSSLETVPGE